MRVLQASSRSAGSGHLTGLEEAKSALADSHIVYFKFF